MIQFILVTIFLSLFLDFVIGQIKLRRQVNAIMNEARLSRPSRTVKKKTESKNTLTPLANKLIPLAVSKKFALWQKKYSLPSDLTLPKLIVIIGGVQLTAFNLSKMLHFSFLPLSALSIVIVAVGLWFYIRKTQNQADVIEALPSLYEQIGRMYRVQPDIFTVFSLVEKQTNSKPLRQILNDTINKARVGLPMMTAFEQVIKDKKLPQLESFVSNYQIYLRKGGDFAQWCMRQAEIQRRNLETKQSVKQMMFQNKLTVSVTTLIVPLIGLFCLAVSQSYRSVVFTDQTARTAVIFALIWWFIGVIIVWRALQQIRLS